MFAGEVRRKRVSRMREFRHWRWHLNELYVKLNGEMVYLWQPTHPHYTCGWPRACREYGEDRDGSSSTNSGIMSIVMTRS
jgi:hypothetical protein